MKTTIYIIRTADSIQFGLPGRAVLDDPRNLVSSVWVSEHQVELPNGFSVTRCQGGTLEIYRGNEHYAMAVDASESPVIIDHKNGGQYIHLKEV